MSTMTSNPVRARVRALGATCRVRLETVREARWLLDRLIESRTLHGLESAQVQPTEAGGMFHVPLDSRQTLTAIEATIGGLDSVEVLLEPEQA